MNAQPTILYTEDNEITHKDMVNAMSILLDARVAGCLENTAADNLFETNNRYDAHVLDGTTPESESDYGIRLALHIAYKLREEHRSGIVSVCSTNESILGGGSMAEEMFPRDAANTELDELHKNGVEFWFKGTERQKMVAWLGTCLREDAFIPRVEWLKRVGEGPGYKTEERGIIERGLAEFYQSISEADRGVFLHTDFPALFSRIREGTGVREVLDSCRLPDSAPKGKEAV
ncbi:MAG TPA: hypothetical protein VMR81_08375 [Patescibacteria group bacterium]|nr:hypothetical protein [Patescibacteria group bacterium]